MTAFSRRAAAVEGLIIGALAVVGWRAAGPAGSLVSELAMGLASHWIQSLGDRSVLTWCGDWFTDRGVLNQDLARALRRALDLAVQQLQHDWPEDHRYKLLMERDGDAAARTVAVLEGMRREIAPLVEPKRLADIVARERMAGRLDEPRAASRQALVKFLRDYLYDENQDFVVFVNANLADMWFERFQALLKDSGAVGTSARRAYDDLWKTSVTAALTQIGQDGSETLARLRELEGWARRIEESILAPHDPSVQRAFLEALTTIETADRVTRRIDIDEALRQVAALPLRRVPASAPLPPGSRMPYGRIRNPLFVGRKRDLERVAKAFREAAPLDVSPVTVASTGLGGVGKTQLAVEFAHRYGQFFAGGVFWLSFSDPDAVSTEVVSCGGIGALDLGTHFGYLKMDEQVRLVRAAWESPLPRLLVFDNCEDESLVARWRPTTGGCRVLLTSRRGNWNRALGIRQVVVDVLPRRESISLLRRFRPDLPSADVDLDAIASELGDLPLALHLAGSFLDRYRQVVTPSDYRAELRNPGLLEHPSLQGRGLDPASSPTDHEPHVRRSFAVSFDRLRPDDPVDALALALLARSSYFAPGEPIPRVILMETLGRASDGDDVAYENEDALARLLSLGLVETETEATVRLHRLLAAFVQKAAPAPDARAAVETTLLRRAQEVNGTGFPAPLRAVQQHLRAVTDRAQERGDERAGDLCTALGQHLWIAGDYVGARPYIERALLICESVLGQAQPLTASRLNDLAGLLHEQGDVMTALPYANRALAICESLPKQSYLLTAACLNNLGALHREQGEYLEARHQFEQALAIQERLLEQAHPLIAGTLNNLAGLLRTQGAYAEARPYANQAVAICELALASAHPMTAACLHDLGALLRAQGDYAEAQRYAERALAICETTLGTAHPTTAACLHLVGMLLYDQGDVTRARHLMERALAISISGLGSHHSTTHVIRDDLAKLQNCDS